MVELKILIGFDSCYSGVNCLLLTTEVSSPTSTGGYSIMRRFRVITLLLLAVAFFCIGAVSHGEEVQRPIDTDNGNWVGLYEQYIYDNFDYWYDGYNLPRVLLLDLDMDAMPELLVLNELQGRWYDGGYIVKIVDGEIIEYYSPELLEIGCTLALAVDNDGNFGWYSETFSAGTGLQYTAVNKLSVTSEMELEEEEWFGYGTEQVYNEESGEVDFVNTGYYVYGQEVDYDTFRREEIKRRQLKILYSTDGLYPFPDEWDEAINEYSILNTAR